LISQSGAAPDESNKMFTRCKVIIDLITHQSSKEDLEGWYMVKMGDGVWGVGWQSMLL